MKHAWIAVLPMLLSLATFRAESAPDDLDPSFGRGGPYVFGDDGYFEFPDVRLLQLANGDIIFTNHYALWRISANAERIDQLDVSAACGNVPSQQCAVSVRALARQPDGKWVAAVETFESSGKTGVGVARFNADGSPDVRFGSGGAGVLPTALGSFHPNLGIAIEADGGILVVGWSDRVFALDGGLTLARFLAGGTPDSTFGANGILRFDRFKPTTFVQASSGKLVLANDEAIMRLLPNGLVDAAFDARDALLASSSFSPHALAEQADGKLVVAGIFAEIQNGGVASMLGLMRLDAQGRRDASFGSSGMVVLPIGEDRGVSSVDVALDSRGRIVVAATVMPVRPLIWAGDRIMVARFLPDGAADTLFAGGGVTTLQTPSALTSRAVVITASDGILIGGDYRDSNSNGWPSPMVLRLQGGDGSVSRPIREERAIEFYHAGFGHYVIAATQREIATLDDPLYDPSKAWRRTGQTFRVWSGAGPHLSAVCRFFSGQSFAPKSSHFYTPYVEECAALRAGSTWTFEGEPFRLQLPTATQVGLVCPAGSVPLYRAYNNGLGGAPNHRYTDDPAILASVQDEGWAFEGDVRTKVFACIPPP